MNRFFRFFALILVTLMLGYGLYRALDLVNPVIDGPERARLSAAGLTRSFIESPSGTIHYRVEGPVDGVPVVLVPGLSTPLFVFDALVPDLAAAGYRVITYDHYGRGFSDRPTGPLDAALTDRQLNDLLAGLNITQRFHLVGYSMGGAVATIYAAHYPERLLSASLIAPAGLPPLDIPAWATMPVLGDVLTRAFGHQRSAREGIESAPDATDPASFARNYVLQSRYRGYPEAVLSSVRHFPLTKAQAEYDRLGQTGLPVLAIWGAKDKTVPLDIWQDLHRRVPQAQLVKIEDTGHEVTYARPKIVTESLERFWAGLGTKQ